MKKLNLQAEFPSKFHGAKLQIAAPKDIRLQLHGDMSYFG
jgi:hypothetical protein